MLVAQPTVLFQRLVNNVVQLGRQVGIKPKGWHRGSMQNSVGDVGGSFASEWQSPRRHLVEHNPEGKEVSARIQILASRLLWRHVWQRSHRNSRDGQSGQFC